MCECDYTEGDTVTCHIVYVLEGVRKWTHFSNNQKKKEYKESSN